MMESMENIHESESEDEGGIISFDDGLVCRNLPRVTPGQPLLRSTELILMGIDWLMMLMLSHVMLLVPSFAFELS